MSALRDLDLGAGRRIPARFLSVRVSRAGGPGGQNVNKVASKVDLRLDPAGLVEGLGEVRAARVRAELANRLDAEGFLQVVSSEHRDQPRNLEAALVRLEGWIRAALAPRKVRRPGAPPRSSRRVRLESKTRRGDLKRTRRPPGDGD